MYWTFLKYSPLDISEVSFLTLSFQYQESKYKQGTCNFLIPKWWNLQHQQQKGSDSGATLLLLKQIKRGKHQTEATHR